jgi:hypothetical protein
MDRRRNDPRSNPELRRFDVGEAVVVELVVGSAEGQRLRIAKRRLRRRAVAGRRAGALFGSSRVLSCFVRAGRTAGRLRAPLVGPRIRPIEPGSLGTSAGTIVLARPRSIVLARPRALILAGSRAAVRLSRAGPLLTRHGALLAGARGAALARRWPILVLAGVTRFTRRARFVQNSGLPGARLLRSVGRLLAIGGQAGLSESRRTSRNRCALPNSITASRLV